MGVTTQRDKAKEKESGSARSNIEKNQNTNGSVL